jgi:hypothetical protein
MSVADILPLVLPICGAVCIFSISSYCCLRRQMRGEYNSLEYRVKCLEQQITSKPSEPIASQHTQANYNQYTTFSQFPPPTAPNSMIYSAPPATNPYVYTI